MSDHHDRDSEKDEKLNIHVTERERDDVETPAATTTTPFSFTNAPLFHEPLYPFEQRDIRSFDPETLKPRHAPAFPRNGFIGLMGSIGTVFLTLLVLKLAEGHRPWTIHITPASLISGILSLNGFLVSMAFAEGATIAWWFHARTPGTTIAQLHHNWSVGSSKKDAAMAGRKLNYVALATLFVALVPLNGFVLQSALTTEPNYKTLSNATVVTPMVSSLPLGFSAALNDDGSPGLAAYELSSILATTFGNAESFTLYSFTPEQSKCPGYCEVVVPGIGFNQSCTKSTIPFDISSTAAVGSSADFLNISFTWSQQSPNVINMTTIWKEDSSCAGNLAVEQCTLQAAVMNYPVEVSVITQGKDNSVLQYYGSFDTISMNRSIDVLPGEATGKNTTWGGFVDVLNLYYGASAVISKTTSGWNMRSKGLVAELFVNSIDTTTSDDDLVNSANALTCNATAASAARLSHGNMTVSNYVRTQIHQSMMYTGIMLALNAYPATNVSAMTTDRYDSSDVYKVRWRYWAASVVVTLIICVVVLPTFWGYWTLPHKATMSPVDTARAFYAPGLAEVDVKTPAKAMLKELGTRSPQDLAAGRAA